jgi:hypothetical protein
MLELAEGTDKIEVSLPLRDAPANSVYQLVVFLILVHDLPLFGKHEVEVMDVAENLVDEASS